jgi:hypothetical protein
MFKKLIIPLYVISFIALPGCIKETYDLDKISGRIKYAPAFSVAAITGDVTLRDIIDAGDTVRFDADNFVRVIIKKDSIFDFRLEDYYDLTDMVSYSNGYKVGEIKIDNFRDNIPVSLNTISQQFTPSLRSTFLLLDDGSPHLFPQIPLTTVYDRPFGIFTNFQSAVFASGTLEISIKNNLTASLNDIKIRLYNSAGHSQIGNEITIPGMNPGITKTATMDLAGKTVTSTIVATITFLGSPGTLTPVMIDMDQSVDLGINGYNLKVQSGRIKVPLQSISSIDNLDTISFDPGDNIEIEKLRINSGNINYHLISNSNLTASLTISLPTSSRGGVPVSEKIVINPVANFTGNINVNQTELNLSTDQYQKYNRIPVEYSVDVGSNNMLIDFNKNDSIHFDLKILNPDFDYVKGYFGQLTKNIDEETIDLDIDDILNHTEGQLHISDPSIKVNYTNSFGIPVGVTLNASGTRSGFQPVSLGLAPFTVSYPTSLSQRTITSSFTINKANSSLPDLLSLPPAKIIFSGSGKMNPQGFTGTRNNYVFGNSRFTGSLEIEIPLKLWINNLQFADTLDNFLKPGDEEDNPLDPENMELFQLEITAKNGFPLGASLQLMLYNSAGKSVVKTINADEIIKAAPVDAAGKATGSTESTTTIICDKSFFEASKNCDKMIFNFKLKTAGDGKTDIRIYSDYSISFKVSVKARPVISVQ